MTATLPTQTQVNRISQDLAPDVVRVRLSIGQDWSGDPAVYFRVTLSDEASQGDRLADVTGFVSGKLFDELGLSDLDHIPYFKFRSQSEQASSMTLHGISRRFAAPSESSCHL